MVGVKTECSAKIGMMAVGINEQETRNLLDDMVIVE